jgi:hypothetical protein
VVGKITCRREMTIGENVRLVPAVGGNRLSIRFGGLIDDRVNAIALSIRMFRSNFPQPERHCVPQLERPIPNLNDLKTILTRQRPHFGGVSVAVFRV